MMSEKKIDPPISNEASPNEDDYVNIPTEYDVQTRLEDVGGVEKKIDPPISNEASPNDDDYVNVPTEYDVQASLDDFGGVCCIGAIAGLAICGPAYAIAVALGLVTVAIVDKGDMGESVRKSGRAVSDFNKEHKIAEKTATAVAGAAKGAAKAAREYDEQHHVVEKTRSAISDSVQAVHNYDKKQLLDNTKAGAQDALKAAYDFDEEHQVVDKTKRGVNDIITAVQEFDKEHHVLEKTKQAGVVLVTNINGWVENLHSKETADCKAEEKPNK
eukprot:CAMPEP_0194324750 /NCGR_PEP_ID=MMETSP0171-20130528/28840_1 /TAXON_ID=218684 /ORGANISM="Corethron pennatum, Strain L29A3" /LENGTH=271 /DNA_ID=CAMNT_0039083721 /DNA_START=108 /DNA_END=923 /DNA_ORIENTATION=+